MHQGGPASGRARYHLHRSSLVIVTHLCLRNINHPLAASQVNVRDNKELPPLTSLSCLDSTTQPYGETHNSLPNRFPQQPRQSRQALRSPDWEGPLSWLPVPPLTWRGGLPLLLSEPAAWEGLMSLILPGKAGGHLRFPAAIPHTSSAQALPPPRWPLSSHGREPSLVKIWPGPVASVRARQPGPRMMSTICTCVAWLGEPGRRAKFQSWVLKGQKRLDGN